MRPAAAADRSKSPVGEEEADHDATACGRSSAQPVPRCPYATDRSAMPGPLIVAVTPAMTSTATTLAIQSLESASGVSVFGLGERAHRQLSLRCRRQSQHLRAFCRPRLRVRDRRSLFPPGVFSDRLILTGARAPSLSQPRAHR